MRQHRNGHCLDILGSDKTSALHHGITLRGAEQRQRSTGTDSFRDAVGVGITGTGIVFAGSLDKINDIISQIFMYIDVTAFFLQGRYLREGTDRPDGL